MLLSQKLADFTKGEADTLRKAMGKKDREVLDKMKPTFDERAKLKGHNPKKLEKIWKDWERFASYAFNKSHSTCYAWIAYQTAYLKANYPAEYMASVLSNNMSDIKQVSFFMVESKRMGIPVLGPDVNESNYTFAINKDGAIRFGLGAVRGIGSSPISEIVEKRKGLFVIVIVGIVFGASHIIFGEGWSAGKFAQASIGGIIIGWVYFRYGFAPAIIIHWATNYFIFSYGYLVADLNQFTIENAFTHPFVSMIEILLIATGIISIIILVTNYTMKKRCVIEKE
jgi:hypothetical protein